MGSALEGGTREEHALLSDHHHGLPLGRRGEELRHVVPDQPTEEHDHRKRAQHLEGERKRQLLCAARRG